MRARVGSPDSEDRLMALVALASAKGSPGVTTAALAVAGVWPRPALLADCDPAGGDVAVRLPGADGHPLDPGRGLLSLAAVGRRGLHPEHLRQHTQTLAGGLDVLAGVRRPEQAHAMSALWPALGAYLDALPGTDVVADCGRVGPDSPQIPLLLASRLVVFVCRTDVASVVHTRERLAALAPVLRPDLVDGVPVAVVVVAPSNAERDVAGVRGLLERLRPPVPLLGHIAYDEKGASAFAGRLTGRVDRSMLVRSARQTTAGLARALAPFWREPGAPPQQMPQQVPQQVPQDGPEQAGHRAAAHRPTRRERREAERRGQPPTPTAPPPPPGEPVGAQDGGEVW